MTPVRVLVVDDSAFARKVIRECLASCPDIEVLDYARDGLEALEKIEELRPDVITLDLVMPNLDGLSLLRALPREGAPRVLVVSVSDASSELGLEALSLGAVDVIHKPTAQASSRLYDMGRDLVAKVLAAAGARPPAAAPAPPEQAAPPAPRATRTSLLVIGASTGGPQALTRVLSALPAGMPVPVAIVLHLPGEYTGAFARRLDEISPLQVVEASDGLTLGPGMAVVARGGRHMRVEREEAGALIRLGLHPTDTPHRPAVDVLFESAAEAYGSEVLAVVLTGMGSDGLRGAGRVRDAGGQVLSEAESSCVVYGMPRSVREAGLTSGEAPIERMARLILSRL